MRFDLLLLVAICCSLLDRCTARLAHCFREGLDGGAKIAHSLAAQRSFANYVEV